MKSKIISQGLHVTKDAGLECVHAWKKCLHQIYLSVLKIKMHKQLITAMSFLLQAGNETNGVKSHMSVWDAIMDVFRYITFHLQNIADILLNLK